MTSSPSSVGRVASLHRYPVKSLAGESLALVEVDARGLAGDRAWAVRDPDGKLGSGKSSRRFRKMDGLLLLSGAYAGEVPVVAFPDGRRFRADDPSVHEALSGYVGRPVRLEPEGEVSHFDDGPVHVVTTSGLRSVTEAHGSPVDVRHFRANLVLDTGDVPGYPEDAWIGRRLVIGDVELEVVAPMPRCVMVTMEQVDLPGDRDLLTTVTDRHGMDFGVLAEVRAPGRLTLDASVRLT